MTDTDILKRSITEGDYASDPRGSPLWLLYPRMLGVRPVADLPPYWSIQRDMVLRGTIHRESMWAGAIYKTITKVAALGWDVEDDADSTVRTGRAKALLSLANAGQGWVPFVMQLVQDYLLTDNGCFIEVVRAARAPGARIIGLVALDSARCIRTGDPDVPALYRSLDGEEHEVKSHQILMLADLPSSTATMRGVGLCAASRCYPQIVKLAALEQYILEKASGDGATSLAFVHGISETQLGSALEKADAEMKRRGAIYYKGKVLIPVMGDLAPSIVETDLKSVPDGFDIETERRHVARAYALNIGIPEQDVQPLSGQGLGTGTQSIILDEAATGMGLAALLKWLLFDINEYVLPASTTFAWDNQHDLRDQKAKAEVSKLRADTRAAQIGSGEISPPMARQLAVDSDDLPREFIATDATAGGSLSDDEKPLTDTGIPAAALIASAPMTPPTAAPGGAPPSATGTPPGAMKASKALIDQAAILKAAAALYDEVVGG